MTVLEKIERCVSLVWDFQEIYGEEDIEDFCRKELRTYPQYNEIMEYFKHIADLEKENAELKEKVNILDNCDRLGDVITEAYKDQLTNAKEIIKLLLWDLRNKEFDPLIDVNRAEQFLNSEGK